MKKECWAFDLDGTMAKRQEPFNPYSVGEPIKAIVDIALDAGKRGIKLLCFTARAHSRDPKMLSTVRTWLDQQGLKDMKITNIKVPTIDRFIDDKAVGVVPDKGVLLTEPGKARKVSLDELLEASRKPKQAADTAVILSSDVADGTNKHPRVVLKAGAWQVLGHDMDHTKAKIWGKKEVEAHLGDSLENLHAKQAAKTVERNTNVCPHCACQITSDADPRAHDDPENCDDTCPSCGKSLREEEADETKDAATNPAMSAPNSATTQPAAPRAATNPAMPAPNSATTQPAAPRASTVPPAGVFAGSHSFLHTLQQRAGSTGLPPTQPIPTGRPAKVLAGAAPTNGTTPYITTPAQAIAPAYGDKWPGALASAQAYQKANPHLPFVNDVNPAQMDKAIPVGVSSTLGENTQGAASHPRQSLAGRLLYGKSQRPDAKVEVAPGMSENATAATLRHEVRHTTQAGQPGSDDNASYHQYVTSPAETMARLPDLNALWMQRGGEFPRTPEEGRAIIDHYFPIPAGSMKVPWGQRTNLLQDSYGNMRPMPTQVNKYIDNEDNTVPEHVKDLRGTLETMPTVEREQLLDHMAKLLPGVVDNNSVDTAKAAAYFEKEAALRPSQERLLSLRARRGTCFECGGAPRDFTGKPTTCQHCDAPFTPGEIPNNSPMDKSAHRRGGWFETFFGKAAATSAPPGFTIDNKIPNSAPESNPFEAPTQPTTPQLPAGVGGIATLGPPVNAQGKDLYSTLQAPLREPVRQMAGMAQQGVNPPLADASGKLLTAPPRNTLTSSTPGYLQAAQQYGQTNPAQPGEQHPLDAKYFPQDPETWHQMHEANPLYHRAWFGVAKGQPIGKMYEQDPEQARQAMEQWHTQNPVMPEENTSLGGVYHSALPSPWAPPDAHHIAAVSDLAAMHQARKQQADSIVPGFTPEELKYLDSARAAHPRDYGTPDPLPYETMLERQAPDNLRLSNNVDGNIVERGVAKYMFPGSSIPADDREFAQHPLGKHALNISSNPDQIINASRGVSAPNHIGDIILDDVTKHYNAAQRDWWRTSPLYMNLHGEKDPPPAPTGWYDQLHDYMRGIKSGSTEAGAPAVPATAQEKSASVQAENLTGPHGILQALKNLDVDALRKQAQDDIASGKITRRDKGVKMLNALEGLRRNNIKPEELMIHRIPVLPPAFRPFAFLGNTYVPGDANELYQDIFKHRAVHDETLKTLGEGGAALTRMNLLNATRALYGYGDPVSPKLKERAPAGYLTQILGDGPKHSFFQRRLISKTIDNVGRSVITVDPDMDMNHSSIPRDMAWTMAGSAVQRRLAQMGMSPVEAIKAVKDRSREATQALEQHLKETPFLLGRSPAWHKFNNVGQYMHIHDGPHIAINPYIAAGLGADHDGDQVNVSLPVLPDSIQEAKDKLMPDKMLFSIKDPERTVALPKHEQTLGIWTASKRPATKVTRFASGQEALAAMQGGDVKLHDEIEIPDTP